jgi:hypothetical protein
VRQRYVPSILFSEVKEVRADRQDQRRAELAAKAEEITAVRRAAQEEARKWAEEEQARELEEEQRRAANMEKRKKKPKDEIISGDELIGGEKKKRKVTKKSKKKKEEDVETESDVPSGVETGEEEGEDMIEKRKRETLALLKARSKVCPLLVSPFLSGHFPTSSSRPQYVREDTDETEEES